MFRNVSKRYKGIKTMNAVVKSSVLHLNKGHSQTTINIDVAKQPQW